MTQVLTDFDDSTTAAENIVYALGGNDRVFTFQPAPNLYGGEGSDFLGNQGSGIGDLFGGPGNDTIHGGTTTDRVYGEVGDDLLVGGEFNYAQAAGGNIVVFNNEPSGSDALYGGDGRDSIWGLDGDDFLYG